MKTKMTEGLVLLRFILLICLPMVLFFSTAHADAQNCIDFSGEQNSSEVKKTEPSNIDYENAFLMIVDKLNKATQHPEMKIDESSVHMRWSLTEDTQTISFLAEEKGVLYFGFSAIVLQTLNDGERLFRIPRQHGLGNHGDARLYFVLFDPKTGESIVPPCAVKGTPYYRATIF